MISLPDLLLVLVMSSLAAAAALIVLQGPGLRRNAHRDPPLDPMMLLFDGNELQHASESALRRFDLAPGYSAWRDLHAAVCDRFPDFPTTSVWAGGSDLHLSAQDDAFPNQLHLQWQGPHCWVSFEPAPQSPAPFVQTADDHPAAALARSCPAPMWQQDDQGHVLWSNAAYTQLAQALSPSNAQIDAFANLDPETAQRVRLVKPACGTEDWFEVTQSLHNGALQCHATKITALVAAEKAKRTFVQTLTRTFAQLPIGLAIFDRETRLALFNPALVELLALPAEFLTRRPTILSFFDRLRDLRGMPEPRNYAEWRDGIFDMVATANAGAYHDTWQLENSKTYAVKGCPHAEGATAFLVEDISATVSQTRIHRKELELNQALLDAMDEGVVVFSKVGILMFSNMAYRKLWGQDPEISFADVTVSDCLALWGKKARTKENWQEIANCFAMPDTKRTQTFDVTMRDGAKYTCLVQGIEGTAVLVRFKPQNNDAALGGNLVLTGPAAP